MTATEVIAALRGMKVQTGSLVCLGCGQEHNCGIHGCAILLAAIQELERQAGMLDAMEKTAKHYKEQRNAAVKQLRRIADCDTCRHNQPCGVDGPKCVACTRGQGWEWDGGGGSERCLKYVR